MAGIKEIKKAFFDLPIKEQEVILKDIYGFSKDIKEFLNLRLLNEGEDLFIDNITKLTQCWSPAGTLKIIKVTQVNSIISKAKKAKVSSKFLSQMEWIAFDGYMTALDDFGGGPESYENKIYDHLKNYLLLIQKNESGNKLDQSIEDVRQYLRSHTNMYCDHIWELFEEITGEEV